MAKADTGFVNIHGKQYETVAHRIKRFREEFPIKDGWGIHTALDTSDEKVIARAEILNPDGKVVAIGHSEEFRGASAVNKTAAAENAETSAIGRALSAAGFIGSEFCSADELTTKLGNAPKAQAMGGKRQRAAKSADNEAPLIAKIKDRKQFGEKDGLQAIWDWAKKENRASPAVQEAAAHKLVDFLLNLRKEKDHVPDAEADAIDEEIVGLLDWAEGAGLCDSAKAIVTKWEDTPF